MEFMRSRLVTLAMCLLLRAKRHQLTCVSATELRLGGRDYTDLLYLGGRCYWNRRSRSHG